MIAGGGLSGCEAALELAQEGKSVTLIEMRPEVAIELNAISRFSLTQKLQEHQVDIKTDHTIQAFRPDGVVAKPSGGDDASFPADTVIVALGMAPVNEILQPLEKIAETFYTIGDCTRPAKVADAIHAGFVAGWRL